MGFFCLFVCLFVFFARCYQDECLEKMPLDTDLSRSSNQMPHDKQNLSHVIYLYIKQESPLKEYDNGRFDFINTIKGLAFCFADMLKFQSTGTLSYN